MGIDNQQYQNYYVITGGPGVGKTTLVQRLAEYGFPVVAEDARKIIREQTNKNGDGLPWKNKSRYARLMMEASLKSYQRTVSEATSKTVFFDRGILDAVCYMKMENIPISEEVINLINNHRYNPRIFILPPWEEIYDTDNERKQTWEEAFNTFDKMKQTYLEYGYNILEVPKVSVEKRCVFILNNL